ncbi:MAG: YdeI/OmpD-associated family protein [Verrucomicrobiae bacterium]|nr:YdeI/OmpD-associated family protein [Verrucomicrobiae bacterium]
MSALWLVFLKKHTGKPSVRYEEAVQEAVCFGWIDGKIRRIDDERYAQRFTPRRKGSLWSALNRRRAERLMKEGLMMPAGLAEVELAKANGRWKDAAQGRPKEVETPAELSQALESRPELRTAFDRLSPRCRAEYAMWIGSAKKPETRERRVAQALERICRGRRLGMV